MVFVQLEPPFFADELMAGLERLSQRRRLPCLFALESGMRPDIVAELTWKRLGEQVLPPMSWLLLKEAEKVRHIRLNYVFWEWAGDKIAAPLLQFQASVERAFECGWDELTSKHRRLVFIDRKADLKDFLGVTQEIMG